MSSSSRSVVLAAACAAVLTLCLCASPASAKVYGRCELAKELKSKYGFPAAQLATWVCIAHRESNYDTAAVSKPNTDKSIDYGIFQINSRWWCDRGSKLGCGISCSSILNNMSVSTKCVKAIYAETKRLKGDGFKAWSTYKFCQSPASYLQGCGV